MLAFAGCNKEDNNSGNAANNSGNNDGGGNVPDGWVDLGLPSGLLWATCNVGATAPEDYGNYFAWGETSTKYVYNWSTYVYGSDYDQLTKYCSNSAYGFNGFTDNLTTLEPSDDAATVNMGNGARTPTKMEWQELMNNTTMVWTTLNGVNGKSFTGRNGNTLFLPAAGYRYGSELYSAGSIGTYWSSWLVTNAQSDAWYFRIDSGDQYPNNGDRDHGRSVRAVRARQN